MLSALFAQAISGVRIGNGPRDAGLQIAYGHLQGGALGAAAAPDRLDLALNTPAQARLRRIEVGLNERESILRYIKANE